MEHSQDGSIVTFKVDNIGSVKFHCNITNILNNKLIIMDIKGHLLSMFWPYVFINFDSNPVPDYIFLLNVI